MGKKKIVVVGAGLVGEKMVECLGDSRIFRKSEIKVLARSSRKQILAGKEFEVKEITPEAFEGIDIALFAGTEGEKGAAVTFVEEAIKRGVTVIDNGGDFRLRPDVPLVVPEVNPEDLDWHKGLIANPNCSTILMVVPLKPLYDLSHIKRIIVTTFQAVSGTGKGAVEELVRQVYSITRWVIEEDLIAQFSPAPKEPYKVFPRQIAFNLFPHIGSFEEWGYTSEEWKKVREGRKILGDESIAISATCVRVPILNVHSGSIYLETEKKITALEATEILSRAPGVEVVEIEGKEPYFTPQDADGKDEVYVGRIREDPFIENGLWLWVVADNLRKGAALNAVQIAEELVQRDLLNRTRSLNPEERFKK